MGIARLVGDSQDLGTFILAQLVCRNPVDRCSLASIGLDVAVLTVTLNGTRRKPDNLTRLGQPCPGGTCLFDQRDHCLALLEVDFSSSRSSKSACSFFSSTNRAAASARAFSLRFSSLCSVLMVLSCWRSCSRSTLLVAVVVFWINVFFQPAICSG